MNFKRIAAIILVFSVLTGAVTAAKAAELPSEPADGLTAATEQLSTEPSTSAVQEETEESTETTEESSEANGEAVAQMSICARATGFPAFFHVWIYIHNLSEETLRIGAYDLPAGEGVSIGSWGMMVTDLWGVYYNVESFAAMERDESDYYSLTKPLSAEDVEKVSEEVRRYNYWDPIFNCTVFAYRVWNCVEGDWLFPLPLPWITVLQLAILGAETHGLKMFVPERERVYRQVGWGDEAALEDTEDWALKSIVA
ncbi:MAG: hypothetical protein IJ264_09155 [Clostridia bacterium]|nr:hypothetical protein [Clostridia bacterium]